MASPETVALPPNLDLSGGCTIRVTAVDPTTGATVAGVNVSRISIFADQVSGDLEYGPYMLVTGPEG